jgi:Methyltransferase domain
LIGHAVRYFPILRLLRREISPGFSILEIGSGPYGVGEYYPHPFVGCDSNFSETPRRPMLPVVASGLQLPFQDWSFDAVIASDVIEHVPPTSRQNVLREVLRVARKIALIGYPCGPRAYALDKRLWTDCQRRKMPVPKWLEEHMLYPFPDETLFEGLDHGWVVRSAGNDNLWFHDWIVRRTMHPRWEHMFQVVERVAPRCLERVLMLADREPCYRRIFALTRIAGLTAREHS